MQDLLWKAYFCERPKFMRAKTFNQEILKTLCQEAGA